MTNEPEDFMNEDAIEAVAAGWLVERDEGFEPGRAEEFGRWCQQDPRHRAAVAQLEATHRLLSQMPGLKQDRRLAARMERMSQMQRAPQRARIIPFPVWRVAAAAAAVLALGFALWWRQDRSDFRQEFATTPNGPTQVTLPDGSRIDLGTDSDVVVNYSRDRRDIQLARGEANFSVAKNPSRPFVVAAGQVKVRAVGTVFKVRYSAQSVDVRVSEGKVEVARAGSSPAEMVVSALVAGQELQISLDGGAPATAVAAAVESVSTAPVVERLVFDGEPLAKVIEEFNRRNRIKIVIDDFELGERPIGGTFDADKVEEFIHALENTGEISAEWSSNSTFVLTKGN